jgi:hypothetical protein
LSDMAAMMIAIKLFDTCEKRTCRLACIPYRQGHGQALHDKIDTHSALNEFARLLGHLVWTKI